MLQDALIESSVEALVLYDGMATKKYTPLEDKPLVKDEDGPLYRGQFSYISVEVMLLYLVYSARPDISYSINFCSQYMFSPNHFYELTLKQIGHYLKAAMKKGLVLNISLLM